jgi:gliding motility-associated-like protein
MKNKILAFILLLGSSTVAFSQIGVDNIEPESTFVNDTIVITGSGFSATAANLEVWFGAVRGTIIASSDYSIEVKVPAQARATNITVINKSTNLSAMSEEKFIPALRTEAFTTSKFVSAVTFMPNPTNPQNELFDLCVCDLNNDNKPDIATTKFQRNPTPYRTSQDIMILQNNTVPGTINNASFTKIEIGGPTQPGYQLSFPTDNTVCGDLNGDGKPELIMSRAGTTRNSIHILRNTTVGTTLSFAQPAVALFLPTATDLATRLNIRDLNNDGKPELIVTNSNSEIFYIFINQSTTGSSIAFNPIPISLDIDPTQVGSNSFTYDLEVQDFNNDGWADIIINRFVTNNFYVFRNTKSSTIAFGAPSVVSTPPTDVVFNRVTSADFNKDGKLDLVFTNSDPANAKISAIYLNTSAPEGNITFTPHADAIKFNASAGAWGVDVTDIDGDQDIDFVVATKDVTELNVYLHNGNFATPSFSKQVIATPGWNPRNIKAADIDGDAKPEIIFIGQNGNGTTAVNILQNTLCHQPVIENEDNLKICTGQTIILKAHQAVTTNGVTAFAWTKDGAAAGTNSPFLTITAPGVYRVTNTANSCGLFDEITVTFDAGGAPADPDFTSNSPLCVGATLVLTGSPNIPATYIWTKPDGSTITETDPNYPGGAVGLADAGFYSLQMQVGVCKSDVVTKRVDVANMGNFAIAATPGTAKICAGQQISLTVPTVASHTYAWERNGAPTGQTTNSINVSDEASYTVVVTNTALTACFTETIPVVTTVYTTPVAAHSVQATACTGVNVPFTNQTTSVDSRGTIAYSWNFGDATNSIEVSPATKKYTNGGTFQTTVTASYTDVTGVGCSDVSDQKQIVVTATVVPIITIDPSNTISLCPDGTAILSVAGTFNSVSWSNSTTGNSTTVTGPAIYTVTTVDANNCPGTDDFEITAKPVPTVTASAEPATIRQGETSQLAASGAVTYSWTPVESLSDPLIANPVATPIESTTYTVVGANAEGCTHSVDLIITVSGVGSFPVAFSPNGDTYDDTWEIGAENKADCTLSIFDGRGRRIYEGKGKDWDGTYKNNTVPAGTYYYVFACPTEKPIRGSVLVIR